MTTIRNLEGNWTKQAAADLLAGGRFVGRISATNEAGVQRLTARDLNRNIIASHEQPKGLPWGTDQITEWVAGLDFTKEA